MQRKKILEGQLGFALIAVVIYFIYLMIKNLF